MTTFTKILVGLSLICCLGIGLGSGFLIWHQKTITTKPTTSQFAGVPDSVKTSTVPIEGFPPLSNRPSKQSLKPDTVIITNVIIKHDTLQNIVKKFHSYFERSDSLVNVKVEAIASCPVDSFFLTIDHFAMKEIEVPDQERWKYFDWGMLAGAVGLGVLEYLVYDIFKR
jgi:hypothetical protein